jgi:hypothetical protein
MKPTRRRWFTSLLTAAALAAVTLEFQVIGKPVPKSAEKTSIKTTAFHEKQFNNESWELWGKNTDEYVRKEKEGLRITLPAANGPATPVGIVLRYKVRGDFEFEASIETIKVPAPPARLAAGIQVYLKIESPPRPGFFVGKMHDRIQGPVLHAGVIADLAEGRRAGAFERKIETKPAEGESRIRLTRRGSKVEFLAREAESRTFTTIGSLDVSDDDISFFRLAAEPGERPDTPVDVRILSCSIQAREFVPIVPEVKK